MNETNRFELYAVGAPQRHGQNLYRQNIASYSQELAGEVSSESEVQPLATNVQPMASGLADVVQPMASELAETAQPIGSELKEVAQTIVPEAVSEETPPGVDIPGRQIENNDGYPKRSISIENWWKYGMFYLNVLVC